MYEASHSDNPSRYRTLCVLSHSPKYTSLFTNQNKDKSRPKNKTSIFWFSTKQWQKPNLKETPNTKKICWEIHGTAIYL